MDDNATTVRLLERLLALHGFEIESFTDAAAAVERAGETRFDVLFVDLRMHPFGGLEVLRRTRNLIPRRYVLTGYADSKEEDEAMALGASAVLQKPIDAEEIIALIRSGA